MVNPGQRADKRGTFDICADMLLVLEKESECNRSVLAIKSNLDSRALSKYMGILLKFELALTAAGHGRSKIMISEKGKRYLHQYTMLVSLLDSAGSRSELV